MKRLLVCRHRAAGFYFLHEEDEGNHSCDATAENPEVVDVGEHGGLPVQIEGDDTVRLTSGFGGARAVRNEHVRGVRNSGLELAVSGIEPSGQIRLMHLRAPREHGGDEGNADAAADIAREVDESGSRIVF